jgi:hypothetical protein
LSEHWPWHSGGSSCSEFRLAQGFSFRWGRRGCGEAASAWQRARALLRLEPVVRVTGEHREHVGRSRHSSSGPSPWTRAPSHGLGGARRDFALPRQAGASARRVAEDRRHEGIDRATARTPKEATCGGHRGPGPRVRLLPPEKSSCRRGPASPSRSRTRSGDEDERPRSVQTHARARSYAGRPAAVSDPLERTTNPASRRSRDDPRDRNCVGLLRACVRIGH